MQRRKSGKDIVDGLERHIARAKKDLQMVVASAQPDDPGLYVAVWNAFDIMTDTNHLIRGLVRDLPAPERPAKKQAPQQLPEPTLAA
jgi:hypothetical protein